MRRCGSALALLWALAACTSDLDLRLDGKQCQGAEQGCLDGFVCDVRSNLCVRPEQLASAGGAAGSTGDGPGSGGELGVGGSQLYSAELDGGSSGSVSRDAGQGDAASSPAPDAATASDAGPDPYDAAAGDAAPVCTPSILYPDQDGDGVGLISGAELRCPAPGWVSQAGDCRDDEERVFLGQEAFSAEAFPDPTKPQQRSFDFDCSGSEEPDPDNSPAGPAPNCAQLVTCTGSGYLPAVPARSGAGIEPRCGSNLLRRCVAGLVVLTCIADDVALADELRFRCR